MLRAGALIGLGLAATVNAAYADGGRGGDPGGSGASGGASHTTSAGDGGTNATTGVGGGGGGGAGITGGNGGNGTSPEGAGGSFPGGSGANGIIGGIGGGGGGGGAHGYIGSSAPTLAVTGGNGGAGGDSIPGGGGGGGGAGGYGAVITGSGPHIIGFNVTGGDGGAGGSAPITNGLSGDGGYGLLFTNTSGVAVTIASFVYGGNGNAGGIGISGANLTITNHGWIEGGFDISLGNPTYAVEFTGGTNSISDTGVIIGGVKVVRGSFMPATPGSVVGTPLSINGPLTFASGTQYIVRLTPTANDSAFVSGPATLTGASVAVQAGNGTYTVGRRTILTAGTISTTFSGVTSNLAFLAPTLSYDPTHVFLTIAAGTTDAPPVVSVNPKTGTTVVVPNYSSAAATSNQHSVGNGLTNGAIANGDSGKVLTAVNQLTVPQARAAFDDLSGEGITATQGLANRSAQQFNDAIFDQTTFYGSGGAANQITLTYASPAFVALAPDDTRAAAAQGQPIRELADLPASHIAPTFVAPARTWRAWASGFGGVEDIHGNGAIGSATQNDTIYGGTLGVDYQLMPNYLAGIALGGSDGAFQVPGRTTTGSTTGGHIAFYDLATFGQFYGASSSSFSYYDNKTTRSVAGFGGLGGETERGDFNSHEFRTRLEFGRHFGASGAVLTPFVALEIAQLRSNGFNETSVSGPGLFRLNVSGQSAADVPGYLGLRYQTVMPLGSMTFLPSLQVAYVHEFAPNRSQIGAIVDLPNSTFLVTGAQPARDAAQVKAGGELKIGPNSALFANFDGEFSGVNTLYAGKGGFRWLW